MRILYVTGEYITPDTHEVVDGGLANYLHKISRIMVERGHDVHVLVDASKYQYLLYNGIHVHFCPLREGIPTHGFKTADNKILFLLKYWKVYLEKLISQCPFIGRYMIQKHFRQCGASIRKNIMNIHEQYPIDIVQYPNISYESVYPVPLPYVIRLSSYRRLCLEIDDLKEYGKAAINTTQNMMKQAPFMFGPSKYVIELYKQEEDFKNKDFKLIETLRNPVIVQEDNSRLEEVKKITNNFPYLIFYGSISILKGCLDLAEILAPLFDKYPDLYFVLVGKTYDREDTMSQILSKAGKYAHRIIRFDKMPHSTLYPLIKGAKGVVLPSRLDNFPNTCVEAMSLKKAIVGTYEGSFNQLLVDNVSGFICHGNNPPSLFDAICRLMDSSEDKLKEMGELAYQRTLDLEPDKIAEQTEAYYQYVIDNWKYH